MPLAGGIEAAYRAELDAADDRETKLAEIEERKKFLEDAHAAGMGGKYDAQLKAEMAERVRLLRSLGQKADAEAARLAG